MRKQKADENILEHWQIVDLIKIQILRNADFSSGMNLNNIVSKAMTDYDLTNSEAAMLANKAYDECCLIVSDDIENLYNKSIIEREILFIKAKVKGDLRLALQIVKDRDQIIGLYKVIMDPQKPDFSKFTDDELHKIINRGRKCLK